MIKKNWKTLLITSVVMLLPMVAGLLLWSKLPDKMPTHWNTAGEIDGWSSKPFSVFALPGIMLACQWLCALGTAADPKKKNHSDKVLQLVLWIIPVMSVVLNGIILAIALGGNVPVEMVTPVLVGLILTIIGNYLPKCKQNYTIGIKIPWTLNSEENWNRTHRFAGVLWVICGAGIVLSGFMGQTWLLLIAFLPMTIAPVIYSYLLHRKGI